MVQMMVIDVKKPTARTVTTGVPRGSIVDPIRVNLFINDLDDGAQCILSRFAGDTKLGGATDTQTSSNASQSMLNRLDKLFDGNTMKFSKEECKVLQLQRNNHMYQYLTEAD